MDLNSLKGMNLNPEKTENTRPLSINKDIAIVGIDAKVSCANSVDEFWKYIEGGCDLIRDFPEERKEDANRISLLRTGFELKDEILQYGYLDRIDLFDPDVFGITNPEAILMDPNQRLFLESAWKAIEDAGYGGESLNGSSTGVYIGVNNIQNHYGGTMDEQMDASMYGLAVSGNVNSIVASRISYLLNLKGPAVVFDTACSSSLVAVHFACQQLKSREVSTAIVGGIRVGIIPPQGGGKHFGIEAFSGRTRSYDKNAEGTGGGEGVICMVLKRLEDAKRDHDHIYAVIKGSAINQDGTSVGITAPNALSQEDCIKNAWRDAGIDPESISYIEGHGTATALGDPIEIAGIDKAFRNYTDKKQFCAIGSVKSNVGHLDSAAGIVGLLKVVLMMKYKKIPASIHFSAPNKKINFIDSPVYVNDTCVDWIPECGVRRAGISSFGISGTNCHLVLEEFNSQERNTESKKTPYLLTIAAKNQQTAGKYLSEHKRYLAAHRDCNLNDYCFTANTGRTHFNSRIAVLFNDIDSFLQMDLENDDMFCGEYRVVDSENGFDGYISVQKQKELSNQAAAILRGISSCDGKAEYTEKLRKLCELYVHGADIDWKLLYDARDCYRMSIPEYPFNERRFWHNIAPYRTEKRNGGRILHPLVDACIADSYHIKVYEKRMNPNTCWELREHMLNGEPVLPGSALLEMAYWGAKQVYPQKNIELRELHYLSPLHCAMDETRIVHLSVNIEKDSCYIQIVSKEENKADWTSHLEVRALGHSEKTRDISVEQKMLPLKEVTEAGALKQVEIASTQGSHWSNLDRMFIADKQIAVLLDSSQIVQDEKKRYYLYPPTLDTSLNAGTYIVEGEYLPFSFDRAVFYSALPDRFYSFIKQNDNAGQSDLISFDIVICDENGVVIAEITNYLICRVLDSTHFITGLKLQRELFYKTEWIPADPALPAYDLRKEQKSVLIVCRNGQNIDDLSEQLSRYKLYYAIVGDENRRESDTKWYIRNDESSLVQLFAFLKEHNISKIVQFSGYTSDIIESGEDLNKEIALLLKCTFFMVKALVQNEFKHDVSILLVTKNGEKVTEDDNVLMPLHTALIGLGTCINDEYNNIAVHAVDIDDATSLKVVCDELKSDEERYLVAYRKGDRYVEQIVSLPYSEKSARSKLDIKEDGVYVIAGGLGGMGLVIMQHLFEHQPKAKIALLNRSYSESAFSSADSSNDEVLLSKQKVISKARNDGYQVEIIQVDISNYHDLDRAFTYLRDKYTKINGVINAAGVAGDGFIYHKDWKVFENVLKPKIHGSWNLDNVTASDDLDFFVMCSSQTSIFGAPGQSDYAAANAFLDGFTHYRSMMKKRSLTIDWTGWSEAGMAASNENAMRQSYVKFLTNEEGALAFAYALKSNEERILIGKYDMEKIENYPYKLNDKIGLDEIKEDEELITDQEENSEISFEDIVVYGKNAEELSEVEKKIVCIWANVLNTTEVDVYDKFFEIGGNSLLALNLQKALNAEFGSDLTITDIFVYSSIIELSGHIDSNSSSKSESHTKETNQTAPIDNDIDELYEKLMNGELDTDQILNL